MMKTKTVHEIMFKPDRNGRKRAYYFSRDMFRWFPMGLDKAEFELSTGAATLCEGKRFPTTGEVKAQAEGEAIFNAIMKGQL